MFKKIFIDSKNSLLIEVYIKPFNPLDNRDYILQNSLKLLPDWKQLPQTIIFCFFQCKLPLDGHNLKQETIEKDRLLSIFYQMGLAFYSTCKTQQILTEVICPKSGYPLYSAKGKNIFSIQNIVTYHLNSFKKESKSCGLIHPHWGKAVYPCVIISLAKVEIITPILTNIMSNFWNK